MVAMSLFSTFSQMTWERKQRLACCSRWWETGGSGSGAGRQSSHSHQRRGGHRGAGEGNKLTGMRSEYFWRMRSASALRFSKGCSSLNLLLILAVVLGFGGWKMQWLMPV